MDILNKTLERNRLLTEVMLGRLEPVAAEAQAMELGIGALLPLPPDPKRFDPNSISGWSLLMAVSWVAFRKLDVVRWCWHPFLAEHYDWGALGAGFVPKRRPARWLNQIPVSIWDDELTEFHGADASFQKGFVTLRQALAGGRVLAMGRDVRTDERASVGLIPKYDWLALHLGSDTQQVVLPGEQPPDMLHFGNGKPVYVNVAIDLETLIAEFPADGSSAQLPPPVLQHAPPEKPEPPAPIGRVPKKPSPENAAVTGYIMDQHKGVWPIMSDEKIRVAAKEWVEKGPPDRRALYPIFKLSKSVVVRHQLRPARHKPKKQ